MTSRPRRAIRLTCADGGQRNPFSAPVAALRAVHRVTMPHTTQEAGR